jgi:nicotinate-nucleotide adenylyltransferase
MEDRGLYGFSGYQDGIETPAGKEKESMLRTIVKIENAVRNNLEFGKFIHSRNTALLSWDLCRKFGLDSQKGYLAGIAHDMCKVMDAKELIRLARGDGGSLSKLEQKKPGLLHARAAAVLLQRRYGITDRDILEAIRYHTTGFWDMNALAKVVYIADKIEISRPGVDPALRKMSRNCDLDTLFAAVLNNTVKFLRARQLDISYGTRRLLAAMQKRNRHEKDEN